MILTPKDFQNDFPWLNTIPLKRPGGATGYKIILPEFPFGREISSAELILPRGFPRLVCARIQLSPDAVLRVPHVEEDGWLCTNADPGAGQGYSDQDRIKLLLWDFKERFLYPWCRGQLDGEFDSEALNYWSIYVRKLRSYKDPVIKVWTIDDRPKSALIRKGVLLLPSKLVIVGDQDMPVTNRFIGSLGGKAKQRINVLIADIPISNNLIPTAWPKNTFELDRLLRCRLSVTQLDELNQSYNKKGRQVHRIVVFRSPECSFGFLLPLWPPTPVIHGVEEKSYPPRLTPVPLNVLRFDPSWTIGRDQYPQVSKRQNMRVLVLGGGALGSPVVEHLARSGIGRIILLDKDTLEPANLGRHILGIESIGKSKAEAIAKRINADLPSSIVIPHEVSVEEWIQEHTLIGVDIVLDLTGEPNVRFHIDEARKQYSCPLIIGWMEPFVSAAHVCVLPAGESWLSEGSDLMGKLEAVVWPDEVIRQEPGCSSRFQSYTAVAAAYAVALVTENTLKVVDKLPFESKTISWVRGQSYLDQSWPGLVLRDWAQEAFDKDGMILERSFP